MTRQYYSDAAIKTRQPGRKFIGKRLSGPRSPDNSRKLNRNRFRLLHSKMTSSSLSGHTSPHSCEKCGEVRSRIAAVFFKIC